MSFRTTRNALALALAVLLAGALGTLWAVHLLGLFQLEGDAFDTSAPVNNLPDDWQSLFDDPDVITSHEIPGGRAFVHDGSNETLDAGGTDTDTTYFDGGGSKDVLDIDQWMHDTGDVAPAKDELVNIFGALYLGPDGPDPGTDPDLIFYFGADRFANNGAAQIGIWIFKNKIGLNPDHTFSGVHAIGDLLVLSDYTKGGSLSNIQVFEWVGAGGSHGSLDLLFDPAQADCKDIGAGDDACATVNAVTTTVPPNVIADWFIEPKFGLPNEYPPGSLYEGGINLSTFGLSGCISSFLMETRSSPSETAQLKDFALGQFSICDARISITPPTFTNEVGTNHDLDILVEKKDSSTGFIFAPAGGVDVDATLENFDGATASFVGLASCTTAGPGPDEGTCTVTINSTTTGSTKVSASADVPVDGETIHVETNGESGSSFPAEKVWVDARIVLEFDDANEVGTAHTFTVTVSGDSGDGNGMQPVQGVNPVVMITPAPSSKTDNCASTGTNASGQCTVEINSTSAGTFTAKASITLTLAGLSVSRDTDPATTTPAGPGGTNALVHKVYADASIAIAVNDTNGITEPHTFTVTVKADDGSGGGLQPVAGVNPVVTFNVVPSSVVDNCASSGTNASGQCTVVINSNTAGTFVANASITLNISTTEGMVTVMRDTDPLTAIVAGPGGSGPATKTYIAGMISWLKHNNLGQLLGGATFQVCRTHDFASATQTFVDIADVCVTFLDNNAPDADPVSGQFKLNDLILGRYTIKETIPPAGFTGDSTVVTVELTTSNPNALNVFTFINRPPDQGCTPGFWKNHTELWDSFADPVAAAAGFTTSTSFNTFFGLTPAQSGFANSLTMEDALNLGGGDGGKLARHGVAGLLNIAAGLNYGFDATTLYNAIRNAFLTGVFEPLATDIANANNRICPLG